MTTTPTPSDAREDKRLFNFIYDSSAVHGDTNADAESWRDEAFAIIDTLLAEKVRDYHNHLVQAAKDNRLAQLSVDNLNEHYEHYLKGASK